MKTFLFFSTYRDGIYNNVPDSGSIVGNITCTGFYRCNGSAMCIQRHLVCDGNPNCPNKDDESDEECGKRQHAIYQTVTLRQVFCLEHLPRERHVLNVLQSKRYFLSISINFWNFVNVEQFI